MDIYTANKLVELRKANNLSQEELAQHLNISRQAVSKWERAESSPDTDNLIALAKLYRISLDELFEINVKTFVCENNETQDNSRKTISLRKEDDDGISQIFSERTSLTNDGEIYPQAEIVSEEYPRAENVEEIYPNDSNNTLYKQSFNANNYAVPPVQPNIQTFDNVNSVDTQSKKKKKKFRFIDMNSYDNGENSNINFRLLYLFPYYAVAAIVFFVLACSDLGCISIGWADLSDMSYLSFLTIPLYYTGVAALQKRNLNCFCYPVLAVILMLLGLHITGSGASLAALATIPFYYFGVEVHNTKKKNKR